MTLIHDLGSCENDEGTYVLGKANNLSFRADLEQLVPILLLQTSWIS